MCDTGSVDAAMPGVLWSPCDGRVVMAASGEDGWDAGGWGESGGESGDDSGGELRVFLSLWDVHVVRSPLTGRVEAVQRRGGRYRAALNPRAVTDNAQAVVAIVAGAGPGAGAGAAEANREGSAAASCGLRVEVTLVAGLLARGIGLEVRPGDWVQAGQRLGVFRLGSLVRLGVPGRGVAWSVGRGERVHAARGVVGELVAR